MDIAIIRSLFSNTIQAAEILQTDMDFRSELIKKRNKLKKYQIGSKGQLLEWDKEYKESEPQHRHVSHLFGLYPGCDITDSTPEVFKAARKSLDDRGNKTTGWSMAWKISLWSRLYDSSNAYEALSNLINYIDPHMKAENRGGRKCYCKVIKEISICFRPCLQPGKKEISKDSKQEVDLL